MPNRWLIPVLLAATGAASAGCAPGTAAVPPAGALPGDNGIPGWSMSGKTQTYNRQTLFDYIDGSSEYFFTYSFEEVAVVRFVKSDQAQLNAEVWQLAVPEDAYGLFTGRTGGELIPIGAANEASLESGSRLLFWQDRYYVSLTSIKAATDDDLRRFAEYISKRLPSGGSPPELVGRLPAEGLLSDSVKFFHMELAIQDRLWLGGENLLGLSAETEAVFTEYRNGGQEWQMLLVQYPDAAGAESGRQALENGAAENLILADANGPLLAAVFGQTASSAAEASLAKALGK
jgi:hypothetical protein